jgi:hypothetical protein
VSNDRGVTGFFEKWLSPTDRRTAVTGLMTVVSLVLPFLVPFAPAAAQGGTVADPVASATARPLSLGVGLGLTDLVALSVPIARARLNRSPPSSQAAAGIIDIRQASADATIVPGLGLAVTSTNPGQSPAAIAPLGALGPNAAAETPSPRLARSRAGLVGPPLEALVSANGSTEVVSEPSGAARARAVSEIPSLHLFDIGIRGLRSQIEIEAGPASQTLVSYVLSVLELRIGLSGVPKGILVEGSRVPLTELAERFRRDAAAILVAIGSLRLENRLRLVQPGVTTSSYGHVTVTGPTVEVVVALGGSARLLGLNLAASVVSVAVRSSASSGRERPTPSRPRTGPPTEGAAGPGLSPPPGVPSAELDDPSSAPALPDRRATGDNELATRRGRGTPARSRSRLVPLVLLAAAGLNALLLLAGAVARMARGGSGVGTAPGPRP